MGEKLTLQTTVVMIILIVFAIIFIFAIFVNILPDSMKQALGLSEFVDQFALKAKPTAREMGFSIIPTNAKSVFLQLNRLIGTEPTKKNCLIPFDKLPTIEPGYSIQMLTEKDELIISVNRADSVVNEKTGRTKIKNKKICVLSDALLLDKNPNPIKYYPYANIFGDSLINFQTTNLRGRLNNLDTEEPYDRPFIYRDGNGNSCFIVLNQGGIRNLVSRWMFVKSSSDVFNSKNAGTITNGPLFQEKSSDYYIPLCDGINADEMQQENEIIKSGENSIAEESSISGENSPPEKNSMPGESPVSEAAFSKEDFEEDVDILSQTPAFNPMAGYTPVEVDVSYFEKSGLYGEDRLAYYPYLSEHLNKIKEAEENKDYQTAYSEVRWLFRNKDRVRELRDVSSDGAIISAFFVNYDVDKDGGKLFSREDMIKSANRLSVTYNYFRATYSTLFADMYEDEGDFYRSCTEVDGKNNICLFPKYWQDFGWQQIGVN